MKKIIFQTLILGFQPFGCWMYSNLQVETVEFKGHPLPEKSRLSSVVPATEGRS